MSAVGQSALLVAKYVVTLKAAAGNAVQGAHTAHPVHVVDTSEITITITTNAIAAFITNTIVTIPLYVPYHCHTHQSARYRFHSPAIPASSAALRVSSLSSTKCSLAPWQMGRWEISLHAWMVWIQNVFENVHCGFQVVIYRMLFEHVLRC